MLDFLDAVGQHLGAQRGGLVFSAFRSSSDLFNIWSQLCSSPLSYRKKKPLTEIFLPRTNLLIRGATLICSSCCTLDRILTYPRQLTCALTSQNTWLSLLTAPSAVHLMTCFLPDSQHRGLSVRASSPLSPLQRFLISLSGKIPQSDFSVKLHNRDAQL